MKEDIWEYHPDDLQKIKDNAGELYQIVQELFWNACDIPGRPNDKMILKSDYHKLDNILRGKICIM